MGADLTGEAIMGQFLAEVKDRITKKDGCPGDAFVCGRAQVDGYGDAQYRYFLDQFEPTSDSCGDYLARVTFTLADGSVLELAEQGTVCGPGGSFLQPATEKGSYGNPVEGEGSWSVQAGSGAFAGAAGEGTDTFHSAGAHLRASYVGALQH